MIIFKPNFRISALTLALACSPMLAFAQDSQQAEINALREEVRALRALFEQQQSSQKVSSSAAAINSVAVQSQPEAPLEKVAEKISATTAGATFKLYGNVRLDASYQAEGSAADRLYNNINKVPLQNNAEASERLKSTLAATRFGVDIKTQLNEQALNGKVEVDFLGGANVDNLRIRHAYFNYGNWLLGQTWSNFALPDYMPETIDALGYVGGAVKRTAQVRYSHSFNPSTQLIFAAEDPKDSISNMQTPALTARLNHQINDEAKLSLRAMGNEKKTNSDDSMAWGVGLGMQYKLAAKSTVKADYYHVKGDGSFVSWTNPSFSKNAAGDILDENEFDSITLGLSQQFNEKWRGTLGYGWMKSDVSNAYKSGIANPLEINKELWQAWGNVFYSPVKPLSFGVEYVYGEREAAAKAANGEDVGVDNRINMLASYSF